MVLVDVTRMHIPFMTPDEALNSVSHAPVINFLAPNLVGILFRVCELLHELWRPECSFVETAAQELGGHNSDYVSHNSLLDRVTHALHSTQQSIHTHTQENLFTFDAP